MQVLAVGKMSRLLSLSKTSTQSATSSCSGEDADDEIDVEPTPTSARGSEDGNGNTPVRARVSSFDTRDHSPISDRAKDVTTALEREGSPVFENDDDLECAVQNKIKELEKQNLSLKAYLDRGKDDSFSVLTGISLMQRMNRHEKGHGTHGPVRFEESQDDTSRLTLATNLATIKSLQMNSLH